MGRRGADRGGVVSIVGAVILTSVAWFLVLVIVVCLMARSGHEFRGSAVYHGDIANMTEEERERIEEEARAFRVALRRVSPEDFDKGDDYAGV